MLVFWKERLILMAVPKTGTTALHDSLAPRAAIMLNQPPSAKHMSIAAMQRVILPLLGPQASQFQTVATIRHPVDWLSSWYRYRSRKQIAGTPNSSQGMDFDAFVTAYLSDKQPPFARLGSQAHVLTGRNGQIGVDLLFRYEAMPALLDYLSHRFGERIEPQRLNISPRKAAKLSPAIEARLRNERAEDFDLWKQALTEAPF
ncbi:MAG: gamma-glutamyl kinase [Paracoccus sp. (in: a-proteobacteria)]|uniref:gamma-glutamyl kinase n=1 Tax=Paracoccus sp. TaxID=267 RepID=UPI0026DF9399|nr:gamma-glutamyl kinase [Paracoccus sp. (in: a-proteobacteria)]MDO5621976.1 gamma-glutamyl kinase [Paracoccus sp. (in: a-proteobacteria)]